MNQQTENILKKLLEVYGAASAFIEANNEPLYTDQPEILKGFYVNLAKAVYEATPDGMDIKRIAAAAMGSSKSEKKAMASRRNGKLGGRPNKTQE